MSYYSYRSGYNSAIPVALLIIIGIIGVAALVFAVIAQWKLFVKAGERGWKCLIPFYNQYTWYRLTWNKGIFFVFLALSLLTFLVYIHPLLGLLVNIPMLILAIIAMHKTSKSYGKGGGFTVGLIFLPFVFLMILAFGNSEYIGPQGIPEMQRDNSGNAESELDYTEKSEAYSESNVAAPRAKNGLLWAIAGTLLGAAVLFFGAELWLSMKKLNLARGLANSPYIGLRNYELFFSSGRYFLPYIHTLIYGLVAILFSFLLGFAGQGLGKSGKAGKGIGIVLGLLLASVPRFFWENLGIRIMNGNLQSIFLIDVIYSALPWAGLSLAAGAVLANRNSRKVVMPALVVPVMQLMVLMTGQESFPSMSINPITSAEIERADALTIKSGLLAGRFSLSAAMNVLLILFNLLFAIGGILCMAALVKKTAPRLRTASGAASFTDFIPGIAVLVLLPIIGTLLLLPGGKLLSDRSFLNSVSMGALEILLTVILAFGIHVLFQFAIAKSSSAGGIPMALFIFAALSIGKFMLDKYLLVSNLRLLNTIFPVVLGWVFSPRAMAFAAILAMTRPSSVKECMFNALAGAMITAAFGVGTPVWAYVFMNRGTDISLLLQLINQPSDFNLSGPLHGIMILMISIPLGIGTIFTSLSVGKE